jgi:Txe/YoeB family toxin of toxin-antitoxin system
VYWQSQDKKTLKCINQLVKEVILDPEVGIGKPEPLRESLSGFWSRRIDDTHRLVYRTTHLHGLGTVPGHLPLQWLARLARSVAHGGYHPAHSATVVRGGLTRGGACLAGRPVPDHP